MIKYPNSYLLEIFLFLLTVLPATAQKLTVESMIPTNDQTANLSENLVKDLTYNYAGLVKVRLAAAVPCSKE